MSVTRFNIARENLLAILDKRYQALRKLVGEGIFAGMTENEKIQLQNARTGIERATNNLIELNRVQLFAESAIAELE